MPATMTLVRPSAATDDLCGASAPSPCSAAMHARPTPTIRLARRQKADLVFTDPPYNVRIDGHVSGLGRVQHREFAMASGEMTEAEFTAFLNVISLGLA